jgi:hypothetical protein
MNWITYQCFVNKRIKLETLWLTKTANAAQLASVVPLTTFSGRINGHVAASERIDMSSSETLTLLVQCAW